MALNSKTAAALVAANQNTKGKTMLIKLLRDIRIGGETKEKGKKLEVPNGLGIELIGANKAEKVIEKDAKKAAAQKAAEELAEKEAAELAAKESKITEVEEE